jgi:hypothetical protein
MPLEQNKKIEIFSLDDSEKDDFWKIKEKNKERRINLYHFVVHLLAFIIVISFISFIIFNIDIPEVYSTLVSVVIGFYFARSLLKD